MEIFPQLINLHQQSMDYLFCPSENCLNVPEIFYSYNPLKNEVQYKCNCNANYDNKININLQEFLDKSNLICHECKKAITDSNFLFCKTCKNIIDINCEKYHGNNYKHFGFEFIEKNNILNYCKEHQSWFIFRCMNCNESFCNNCDLIYHNAKNHSLKQILDFSYNKKDLDSINSNFEKQKEILEKIKNANCNFIKTLENDIKIKQKIINSYHDNTANYCSIINLKNLINKNNEKYETILTNIFSEKEEKDKYKNDISNVDKFIDQILSPFYYSLMINNDESLNDALINTMENKIAKLKKVNTNNINNELVNFDNQQLNGGFNNYYNPLDKNNKNNNYNIKVNSENNFIMKQINESQRYPQNPILQNDLIKSSSQREQNIENNELSLFSNINDLNKLNFNDENIVEDKNDNKEKNKNKKRKTPSKKNKDKSKDKKIKKNNNKSDEENKKEKKKKRTNYIHESEQNNNFVNNMIALQSGNFAISIQRRVEIYDFRKLHYTQKKEIFDNNLVKKSQCFLQKISFDKGAKGKFISYIFQFVDETLLCPIYSKIIRIKLTNNDKNHEIIGCINLEYLELCRKLISLGDSLLVILSEKGSNCNIKLYSKKDESLNNNLNSYNIINNEMNSICQTYGIINQNNLNINNNGKENLQSQDINKENIIQNNNENINIINEDPNFKSVLDNINEKDKLWTSIFEIKKSFNKNNDINNANYLYEFIATSNADFSTGTDKLVFFGVKKIFGKYNIKIITEIDGISCSGEPNTICQLNKKYLCIGLQNYEKPNQKNGFAIINIIKRELYKFIESEDYPVSSLCFITEKQLLLATMEIVEKGRYFETKVYKLIKNKEDEEKNNGIELKNIFQHRNKQTDVIISIHPIILSNLDKNIIFVTSSQNSHLEIVNAEIENY